MKFIRFAAIAVAVSMPAVVAAQVGVSVTIGEPGFYGNIDIGDYPRPQLVYPEPVIIVPAPVVSAPVYMRVPPGHAMKWDKHCQQYNACGRRVYFVQDGWYENVYAPAYRQKHGKGGHGGGPGHSGHPGNGGKDKGHGKDKGPGKGGK